MADANSTRADHLPTPDLFAVRLHQALAYRQGNLSEQAKILFIAQAAGRTTRTARAWLRGDNLPHRNRDIHVLAKALGASYVWLHFGLGENPWSADVLEKLSALPPEYVPKLTRYLIRLHNGDPKALRWSKMCERGELSGLQVLDMA